MANFIPQDQYNYIRQNIPIICVDICIINNNGVLLAKRNTEPAIGDWWFPGGRLFKGEKLVDCAKRKCLEEVGLNCTIGPIVHTGETVFETGPYNIPTHSVNVCFLAIPSSTTVKLDKYSDEYRWVNKIESDFHPYVQKCLVGCGL